MLLKRGASVDLQSGLGTTALMSAANQGHLSILLLLLEHSANPDLQSNNGVTALMMAARQGQEACVQALLRAEANTEHRTKTLGLTALRLTRMRAACMLIRQHACLTLGLGVALCAVLPLAWPGWCSGRGLVRQPRSPSASAAALSRARRTLSSSTTAAAPPCGTPKPTAEWPHR